MKKLLTLLGALALTASPMMIIVSCETRGSSESNANSEALAVSLKNEIYQKVFENYKEKEIYMSKTLNDVDNFHYSWLSYSLMNNLFSSMENDGSEIVFNDSTNKLSSDDLAGILKDLTHLLDLDKLAITINGLANNKAYDAITSQVNKQIFKGWTVLPSSISRISDNQGNDPKMVQLSFSLIANYQISLNGSVQTFAADKIACSYTIATDKIFQNFITWANTSLPKFLYSAKNSPFLIDSKEKPFDLGDMNTWLAKLNPFKQNLNSNINEYFHSLSTLNANDEDVSKSENIANMITYIFSNKDKYNFSDQDPGIKFETKKVDATKITLLDNEIIQPEAVYGTDVDYSANVPRVNVLDSVNKDNKNIVRAVFGNVLSDKPNLPNDYGNLPLLKKATEEYLELNKDMPGLNPDVQKPFDTNAFYQEYSNFANNYGIELKDQKITDEQSGITVDTNNIYAYGHVNFAPIPIQFAAYSGTFKLNLSIPWSIALQGEGGKDVDRTYSAMSYFIALQNWKKNLNVSYFRTHEATGVGYVTSFMTLDTYDKTAEPVHGAEKGLYVNVDQDLYYPYFDGLHNDPEIYNMLTSMDETSMGSEALNLDSGTIAKSAAWDSLIGKDSRDSKGNAQYYFEKYAGLLPDDFTFAEWLSKSRTPEENGLVYWGFHYDTSKNKKNPSVDVSMPFTSRKAADPTLVHSNTHNFGTDNAVPKNWHAKIRHEKDEDYNDNSLVYTLAMGKYGILNLSFPSFNYSEINSKAGLTVDDDLKSVWDYLWNPHRGQPTDDAKEAMRIIADNDVTY